MIIDERLSVFIDALQWNLPGDLAELERQALEDQVPIIRRPMQTFLGFILGLTQPASILEIGAAVGFSSILMSEYVPEQTSITTIEKVPTRIQAARENFSRYGKEDRICLLEGDAAEVLAELCTKGDQYDFIFMDAAKGQYPDYFRKIYPLLTEDALVVADNVLFRGYVRGDVPAPRRFRTIVKRLREYIAMVTDSDEFQTEIYENGDGLAVSQRLAGKGDVENKMEDKK